MSIREKLRQYKRGIKIAALATSGTTIVAYHISQTYRAFGKIINTNVMDREKKFTPEYIYIDDPAYSDHLKKLRDKESLSSVGLFRLWKSLKHSLAWRLLWLCRHGNKEQRNVALDQLANFKNNKDWDCLKLAQAMDKTTAVLLARTRGVDPRYFLPPPLHVRKAAQSSELLSFKLHDLIAAVQMVTPHSCIEHFLSKHFANLQEQAMESDTIPAKPDSITERELCILCLDALHHHVSLFHDKKIENDTSTKILVQLGLLARLSELFLRNPNDLDLDLAVLRLLTVLSVHTKLLEDFFTNGLIGQLCRLLKSKDVRLSSSAAVCLANLSGEYCYRPGLFLLHPIYRTSSRHACDTLLVHGLRGGVFVTWRQRDRKCCEPLGIIDGTMSEVDNRQSGPIAIDSPYVPDPELRQMIEDMMELEDQALLSEYEVVYQDLPIRAEREPMTYKYSAGNKRAALIEEDEDRFNYTNCWPRDWLPKDCTNLRILGVNYWSSLSEWLERCPLQTADIATRAEELAPALIDAGVGKNDTPIIWLAHSMGGLIVKQVLTETAKSEEEHLKKLCENTKALLFYSTPHKGSALAAMPRAAAAVLWPSNDVRQLQENSPTLLVLHSLFLKVADEYNWETISFAETKPTLVTAFKVPINFVVSNSADLGRGVFYELPLDHLSICKPASRQSILYTSVLDVIQRSLKKDNEVKYSHPVVQWLASIFWWVMRWKAMDETQNTDRLGWFEQKLLDAFTDGFTD